MNMLSKRNVEKIIIMLNIDGNMIEEYLKNWWGKKIKQKQANIVSGR